MSNVQVYAMQDGQTAGQLYLAGRTWLITHNIDPSDTQMDQ